MANSGEKLVSFFFVKVTLIKLYFIQLIFRLGSVADVDLVLKSKTVDDDVMVVRDNTWYNVANTMQSKNRHHLQTPQCTRSISHNATFRTAMCTFLFWMVRCGVWNGCIAGFVRLIYLCLRFVPRLFCCVLVTGGRNWFNNPCKELSFAIFIAAWYVYIWQSLHSIEYAHDFVLLCFDVIFCTSVLRWIIHWPCGSHKIGIVAMKQSWTIWVK